MKHKIAWLIPDRVIEVVLPETCDHPAMMALDSEVISMLSTASHSIHVVVDLRPMRYYPTFDTSRKMRYFKHARMGQLIVIGMTSNPALRFMGRMFGKTVGIDVHDFPSAEEAHAYVHAMEKI